MIEPELLSECTNRPNFRENRSGSKSSPKLDLWPFSSAAFRDWTSATERLNWKRRAFHNRPISFWHS